LVCDGDRNPRRFRNRPADGFRGGRIGQRGPRSLGGLLAGVGSGEFPEKIAGVVCVILRHESADSFGIETSKPLYIEFDCVGIRKQRQEAMRPTHESMFALLRDEIRYDVAAA
jgi:hypothetical protein